MTKCDYLPSLVDLLIQNGTRYPKEELCFFNEKLYPSDESGPVLEVEHVAESQILDRPVVMKKIRQNVKSRVDDFLKASNFGSHRYHAFAKNDVESIGAYFSYFADWSEEATKVLRSEEEMVPVSTAFCLILSDCPIYSTLSRFVASNYAAGKNTKVYVDKKYLIPALTFAGFLCGSGFRNNEISVFSSTHASFPKDNSFHGSVNGVIPIEFPLTTVKDLSKNTRNNIYFKKHSAACPVLVLKSADIDSVVECLTKSTRDQEALWLPNVVYVEEPVYEKFLDTLKFAVNTKNQEVLEGLDSTREKRLNALLCEKNEEGYEVVTLHFLFHSCMFVVNYEFTLLDPSKTDGYHLISILPVRHMMEGVNEMNKYGGLCASIWTNDADQAISIPFDLNYGTIWVNGIEKYNPSVPFSMWNSQGAGAISGKRMLFEIIESFATKIQAVDERSYGNERYTRLPKRTLSESVERSFGILKTWGKLFTDDRLRFMEATADTMIDKNLDLQSKISLNPIPDKVWKDCEGYLRDASVFVRINAQEENIHTRNYLICGKLEPVGVIAILAGTIPLDELFFYIAVALVYGNVVIVGMSSDQQSSIVAHEFEQVFPKGTVTVMIGSRSELWQQFTTASTISSVWFRCDAEDSPSSLASKVHHQTIFNMGVTFNPPVVAKLMMTYATRIKSVWLTRTHHDVLFENSITKN